MLLLSCRFGRFRLHTSLRLRALIRSWQGVYVCKFRSTRTRFQFKKTLPGEHSPENFCCVGPHFQACMNLADVFCLRCFSEARKKHFRRNFRKFSRMRAIVLSSRQFRTLHLTPHTWPAGMMRPLFPVMRRQPCDLSSTGSSWTTETIVFAVSTFKFKASLKRTLKL